MTDRALAVSVGENHDKRVRVRGKMVYLRKCIKPNPGRLVLTDITRDRCNWCEVLAAGPDCEDTIQQGDMAWINEIDADNRHWLNPLGDPNEVVVEEQNIAFVLKKE